MLTQLIHVVSISVLLLLILRTSNAHFVRTTSLTDLQRQIEESRVEHWQPPTPLHLKPNFQQFHPYHDDSFVELTEHLSRLISDNHNKKKFEWNSISVTSHPALNKVYVLLGGSAPRERVSSNGPPVTPRDGGSIILCEFEKKSELSNPMGFGPVDTFCHRLVSTNSSADENEFLGLSTAASTINDNHSVIAYCDPLWRARTNVPVGRCFLNFIFNGQVQSTLEFSEFCQSGRSVATPCMAGYSLAISSGGSENTDAADVLKHVQLWVGEPLFLPHGRVQILANLSGTPQIMSILPPSKLKMGRVGSQFGYSVIDGFSTAPSLPKFPEYQNEAFAPLLGIQTIVNTKDHSRTFGAVDWMGGVKSQDAWAGAGASVLKLGSVSSDEIMVVMGSPYYHSMLENTTDLKNRTHSQPFVNRGRIYLYCLNSLREASKDHISMPDDFLEGPYENAFFGYSLSRLGDIDGDGYEELAVGAPDISIKRDSGQVFIIRTQPGCTFDRTPIQIISGPKGAHNFGSYLPTSSIDMDFNGIADLVVPNTATNNEIRLDVYLTRVKIQADCRFTFPSWLAIRRILTGDGVPVHLVVFLNHQMESPLTQEAIDQILIDEQTKVLIHQVDSDFNSTASKRFTLGDKITTSVDLKQSSLTVDFELIAQEDVQTMTDIESGLFIQYRFLQPCYRSASLGKAEGACSNGDGVKRALVDWSKCIARVPLSRYVCYPRPSCEGDLSISLVEPPSNTDSDYLSTHNPAFYEINKNLVFGEANDSRPELHVKIENSGPTFAGGVTVEMQFDGNLRFAKLQAYDGLENFELQKETQLNILVAANETWVACFIGHLPAPSFNQNESDSAWHFKLYMYYSNFMNYDENTFARTASLKITVMGGTIDPNLFNNQMKIIYNVVNKPNIQISYGSKSILGRMDNRTRPVPWVIEEHRRVNVEELGPRLLHAMQIEHLGPANKLHNVTFRATVPVMLAAEDRGIHSDPYLVYLFREIRATTQATMNELHWVDVAPKLTSTNGKGLANSGSCIILDEMSIVNPRKLVGMQLEIPNSRHRRHVNPGETLLDENNIRSTETNWTMSEQPSTDEAISPAFGTPSYSIFRRIPKEILQCDRVGYRLHKPICAEIICHVEELQRNRPVLFTITGWLWTRTLFDKGISDVDVVTTLTVDQGDVPKGVLRAQEPVGHFYHAETFFFPQIRPKLIHQIPNWPIIVGVVLGVLFLSLLIIILYLLGFFKRRKTALRKARYSKGGADELERNTEDTTLSRDTHYAGFGSPASKDRYDREMRRKRRGRHRAELTILHPADLASREHPGTEKENLLPATNDNEGRDNVGTVEDK